MNTTLSLIILAEVLLTLFVVWGFLHEKAFVAVERRIARAVRRRVRAARRRKAAAAHRRQNRRVVYSPVPAAAKRGEVSAPRAA